jgi:DtxR family Mn-dependent transcriptional regulator
LEAILRLGGSNCGARVSAVASDLGVTWASVSGALKKLKARQWVVHAPYKPILLTAEGRQLAKDVTHRNRILECFLIDVLKMKPDAATAAAHRMGYAVGQDVIDHMISAMNLIHLDAHKKTLQPGVHPAVRLSASDLSEDGHSPQTLLQG